MSTSKSPMANRKINMEENPKGVENLVLKQKQRERHLFPLRINKQTVIYVARDKCNKEYAERYKKEKLSIVEQPPIRRGGKIKNID